MSMITALSTGAQLEPSQVRNFVNNKLADWQKTHQNNFARKLGSAAAAVETNNHAERMEAIDCSVKTPQRSWMVM